jgi:hypothetical protein
MPLRLERRKESVLAAVLLECASMHGLKNWSRSATEMLEELSVEVPPTVRALSGWPHSPRMFTDEVRRIAPQLGTRGISVKFTTPERTRDVLVAPAGRPSPQQAAGTRENAGHRVIG